MTLNYDSFKRPTDHYDERLKEIDEEICRLIDQRKVVTNEPSMPTEELILAWAQKYGFYEDFLNGLFGHILAEKYFHPQITPRGFVKNIPILASFTQDKLFYALTSIRQYENASLVNLSIDHESFDEDETPLAHTIIGHNLSLEVVDTEGTKYHCQNQGGGGFDGHTAFQFLIAPPLPENLQRIRLKLSNEVDGKDFKIIELT